MTVCQAGHWVVMAAYQPADASNGNQMAGRTVASLPPPWLLRQPGAMYVLSIPWVCWR